MSTSEDSAISTSGNMGLFIITSGTVYTTSNGYSLGTIAGGTKENKSKPYLLPDGTPVQGLGATFSIWKKEKANYGGRAEREVYVGPGGIFHLDDVSILVVHVEDLPKEIQQSTTPPMVPGELNGWVAMKELRKGNP
jgi:hypothetical protein